METPQLYALLVGINDYPSINKLSGCVADAEAVADFLQQHASPTYKLHIKKLLDAEATRENIINTFRDHLTQAKAGDTVYFHFSGHGSREDAPVEFHNFFPEGKNETLVCYDSRGFSNRDANEYYDLADKELAVLIAEVAQNNPHIIISLDACHSGGGTRTSEGLFGHKRQASNTAGSRGLESYIDGYYAKQYAETKSISIPMASHVVFSACSSTEFAWETTGNRGLFTQTLLSVLAETGIQASYGDVFERVQIRIRQQGGDQTPQVETFGQASVWSTFLAGESAPNAQENPSVFFDAKTKTWQLKAGALQGFLPTEYGAEGTEVRIFSSDMQTELGTAEVAGVQLEYIALHNLSQQDTNKNLDEIFDEKLTYRADVSGLKRFQTKVFQNDVAEINPDSFLAHSAFAWVASHEEADYYLDKNEEGELEIIHQKTEKIIQRAREINYFRQIFDKIGKWEALRVLQNSQTQLKPEDLPIRLEIQEKTQEATEWIPIEIGADNKIYLDVPKISPTTYRSFPYKLHATNKTNRELHMALLFISPLYGVRCYENKVFPADGAEALLYESKNGFTRLAGQDEDKEVDILLKIVISTQRIEAELLEQENFSLNIPKRASSRNRSPEFDADPRFVSPTQEYDWCTKELAVHLSLEQGDLKPAKNTTTGNMLITAPEGFSAKISIENIDTNTRGVGDTSTAVWKRLAQQGNASVLRAGKGSRSTIGGQEIITLSNVQGTVSEDKPLKIKLNETLQENEILVPFALYKGVLVPIGFSTEANQNVLEIYTLPEPDQQANTRSIGRAIHFCITKMVKQVMQSVGMVVNYDYIYQLRSVTFDDSGNASYETDFGAIRDQVGKTESGKILLLIHGIIGNTKDMVEFAKSLWKTRYDLILTFDYENLSTAIEDISLELKRRLVGESAIGNDKRQLEGIGISSDKKIDILAHSMGGLISRWMIEQKDGNEFVNRLVMCGTPNGGSNFGKIESMRKTVSILGILNLGVVAPFFKTLGQMNRSIQNNFFQHLNNDGKSGDIPYYILAGNVQNYITKSKKFGDMLWDVIYELVGNAFNAGEPNDIAVLTEDIKQTGKNNVPQENIFDIPCHHLNYFVEENSVKTLLEILK